SGRVLDEENAPRADVVVETGVVGKPRKGGGEIEHRPERILTGSDGRFQVEGIAPGLPYRLVVGGNRPGIRPRVIKVSPMKPGETRDLGDQKLGARPEGQP
ncbi:carboxypeptidase-like regulatory domain-containing protein, partial [Singulisphaera rosea]